MNEILFENDACIVINKCCGEDGQKPSGLPSLRPVHRLDTPASGCLLLAKTPKAAAFLSAAFSHSMEADLSSSIIEKCYWAIVEMPENALPENAPLESRELIHWISFDRARNKSFAHAQAGPDRKKAVLRYCQAGKGDRYLFLEIDLITGRHHQIRAQLAALGLHIKGDLKYGARRSERSGGIRLHAYSLRFPNPLAPKETIEVNALPPMMDTLWEAFSEISHTKAQRYGRH
ncbi:MAG: RNA pseudouridine synthase [Treponema sp.]|jgi:23S rRNA pseudouridine1911/1915/1917 synthase|nr:RNA pseudouridine synthase [Treponema sp.]